MKNGEVAYDNYVWKCWELSKSPSGVAEEIGISKSLISRWRNGGSLSDATAVKICNYFGISLEELNTEFQSPFEKQKKSADQKVSGLVAAGYDDLTPENRAVIDSLIAKLL